MHDNDSDRFHLWRYLINRLLNLRTVFILLALLSSLSFAEKIQLSEKDKNDPQRLFTLAQSLFPSDTINAAEILDHALSLSIEQNDTSLQTKVLILQSKIAFVKKDYFLSQQHLKNAEKILAEIKAPSLKTKILYLTADVKRKLKNNKASMGFIQKALTQAQELQDPYLITQSLIVKGAIEKDLKRYSVALNTFLSIEEYLDAVDPADQITVLRNIANMYTKTNDLPAAISFFQRALVILRTSGLEKKTPLTLLDIAKSHRKLGQFSQALKSANQALMIAKEVNDEKYILKALVILSRIYRKIGSYEDALTIGLQALTIYEKQQNYNGIALSAKSIGLIYVNLNQHQDASVYFEKILALPATNILPMYRVAALREQGLFYLQQKNHDSALKLLNEAHELYDQLNDEVGLASVKKYIGMVYQDLGDISNALSSFDSAITISQNRNDAWSEAILLAHKAQLLSKSSPRKAINIANKSLTLAQSLGAKIVIEKAYTALIHAEENIQLYKEALAHSKLKEGIIDDIKNETVNKRIAEIRFVQEIKSKLKSDQDSNYNSHLLKLDFDNKKQATTIAEMSSLIKALQQKNTLYFYLIITLIILVLYVKFRKQP